METRAVIEALVNTKSIVYVGASASAEKMSGMGIRNIWKSSYCGDVYAVNIKGEIIEGRQTLRSVAEIPDGVETAFITLPAKLCPQTIRELGEKHVKTAIVAVGGFSELGSEQGKRLEEALKQAARDTGIRIVGPVCNGIYSTPNHLAVGYNAVHGRTLDVGQIGLVSHSGALLAPLIAFIESSGAGLSRFFSCGSEIDLCMTDYIDYLITDEQTKVIALIVDSVGDGERFKKVLRRAHEAGKPVVALKLGDSAQGKSAAMAHSSHLAGSREVYDTVFREEGVMKVPTLESLAVVSAIIASGRVPRADTATACCPSGGGGIMLVDRMTENGVNFCELSQETLDVINRHLVFESATVLNPFDLGLGGRDNYRVNVGALANDPGTGVLICYVTPVQTARKRVEMARAFADVAASCPRTPVIILFPGKVEEDERAVYSAAKLPVVSSVLETVAVTKALLAYGKRTQVEAHKVRPLDSQTAKLLQGHGSLSENDSKQILRTYGMNICPEKFVDSREGAFAAADEIGYPVVLKACGSSLRHKSEYRLVELDLRNKEALGSAYDAMKTRLAAGGLKAEGYLVAKMAGGGVEVNFGVTRDPEFGLVAILGPGGVMAELMGPDCIARGCLPLDRSRIQAMIDATPLKKLLNGYRGSAESDVESLIEQISNAAEAAEAMGDNLVAMDVNPITVKEKGKGAWALDALIILK